MRKQASVYRFGDCVALHSGDGETRYLRAKAARALARRLIEAARSIERETFSKSSVGTLNVETWGLHDDAAQAQEIIHG